jgi:biotin synthase
VQDGRKFGRVLAVVRGEGLGLETCATLGVLDGAQAEAGAADLDYYNHNLDTGRSHCAKS